MRVYTAIYGDYDPLYPHADHPDVDDWICFTDNPELTADGWTVIVEPPKYLHPRLSAKWRKCHPPTGTGTFWIDGSIELHNAELIDVVAENLSEAPMTMFAHPWRDCIYTEIGASVGMAKYAGLEGRMNEQVGYYRSLGWKDHAGLWASTVIGRRDELNVHVFGAVWFAHCELFSYQDQLSLPYLLDQYGIVPAPLPHELQTNPWFHWHAGHNSDL